MGVKFESLPPWAQEQVTRKLARQAVEKAAAKKPPAVRLQPQTPGTPTEPKNPAKYRNSKAVRQTASGELLRFDSRKEARRYDELIVMLEAGEIGELKLQPQFTLQEAYKTPDGVRSRAIRYVADFSYKKWVSKKIIEDGREIGEEFVPVLVIEDVKSRATKTREYEMKKKLMRERFGIEIQEV